MICFAHLFVSFCCSTQPSRDPSMSQEMFTELAVSGLLFLGLAKKKGLEYHPLAVWVLFEP